MLPPPSKCNGDLPMANDTIHSKELSRRSFLESAAALGALGLIGPGLLTAGSRAAYAADGEVLSGCHWGVFRAKVEGGKATAIRGWEKDAFPSHQLEGVLDSIYA